MANKPEASDIYETIRNAGFQLETQLNEWIQDQLNEEKLVLPAAFLLNVHGKLIQFISEFQEIISLHLNTPTKDDVANVAKLLVQIEEKVDDLNDRMDDLAAAVEELRTGTDKRPASSHSSSARDANSKRKSEAKHTKKKVNLEELLSPTLDPKSFILLDSDEIFLKLLQDIKLKKRMKR
ncbi:hypothetical protein NLX67_20455 [Domibacillus sp. A3M-37]|uniref:hypothetical protein n=1 Tax=Domibacillus sp. A3M-37 TaxID=2962037 RepID=UPI0020B70AA9|nr:hypothetical protein [Domibacillus sp. A3M-37]MCP3764710.1 hypothetical protein [Domibacillus sp. A3M-37]